MTLQQILYTLTISDEGSMNKAAEKLYISQPTLTASIRTLEEELHVRIFNRSSHGVTLTDDGREFLSYARQIYMQYETLKSRYEGERKNKFRVSTQHYSFATKAFVNTVLKFGTTKYDLAISETKTMHVIEDVGNAISEIGILYLSANNRRFMKKKFDEWNLEFHKLGDCDAYVYLYREHLLAQQKSITYEELLNYPNMTFDQGVEASQYTAEEILTENEFPQKIKVNDRATMLNLMRGLNGYTLCSGIISEDLNGDDYVVVPYEADQNNPNSVMEIGWISRRHTILSEIGQTYIKELEKVFHTDRME
ncbi:MAG: LysR family transcriptional regulator [Bulleidia sp.]